MKKLIAVVLIVAALALIPRASAKAANVVFTCREGDSCPTLSAKFLTVGEEMPQKDIPEETPPCDDCGRQSWAAPGPHSSPFEGCGEKYGEEHADPLPSPIPARNR